MVFKTTGKINFFELQRLAPLNLTAFKLNKLIIYILCSNAIFNAFDSILVGAKLANQKNIKYSLLRIFEFQQ